MSMPLPRRPARFSPAPGSRSVPRRPGTRAWRIVSGFSLVTVAVAACTPAGQSSALGPDPGPGSGVAVRAAHPVHGGPPAPAGTAVYTQRGGNSRVGWNYHETVLNTGNVTVTGFGRRISYPVDGKIYAQPLFVPGLRIDGGVHNVVIVATERDSVYAFDADATGPAPAPLWHASFLVHGATPVPSVGTLHCDSIVPTFGITGTPVIDRATGTLYLVAVTKEGRAVVDRLHALSIATGRDRMTPVVLRASVPQTGPGHHGAVAFRAAAEQQHMALLLSGGVVYAGFASYCDRFPSDGWILGYLASDLRRVTVYNAAPDGYGAGIWQSATGIAADSAGDLFVMTANGTFDLASGGPDGADSVLELHQDAGTLRVKDYFTPFYQSCLNDHDQDLGSGAPLLLPHELLVVGKEGAIDVLNRAHLGGYHTIPDPCAHMNLTTIDQVIQELPPQTVAGGIWGTETYWQGAAGGYVYIAGEADRLSAWRLVHGKLVAPRASHAPEKLTYPGGIPVGSSDGPDPRTAIVWILDQENGPALRAYSAANLAHELYNTQQDPRRDAISGYDNFTLPTVAGGRVFVGASGELVIYGLLSGS